MPTRKKHFLPYWARLVFVPVRMAVLIYAGLAGWIGCSQRSHIYFPIRLDSSEAESIALREGLEPWHGEDNVFHGWRKAGAPTSGKRAVLIFHGNAGNALHRAYFVKAFEGWDATVHILEYPGYGMRQGRAAMSEILVAAEKARAELTQHFKSVYLVGESIGSGVAGEVTGRDPDAVDGVLFLTPFASMVSLAQSKMPFLPVNLILSERYEPLERMALFQGRAVVVVAEEDHVIPPRFGQALYDGLTTSHKKLWVIPGAGHNSFAYSLRPGWWREVVDFLFHEGGEAK